MKRSSKETKSTIERNREKSRHSQLSNSLVPQKQDTQQTLKRIVPEFHKNNDHYEKSGMNISKEGESQMFQRKRKGKLPDKKPACKLHSLEDHMNLYLDKIKETYKQELSKMNEERREKKKVIIFMLIRICKYIHL